MKEAGTRRVSRIFSIAGLVVVFLFSIAGIRALAQVSSGTIQGIVLDPSHAAIPGATVTILNTQTGLTRTAVTDARGAYRVPSVPTGVYSVKIEKTGFRTLTRPDQTVTVAESLVVNATLQVGSTQQQVVVTGAAAIVNTTTTTLGGLVNDASISQLPLNGRNYTTLVLLQPGVSQEHTGTAGGQVGVWYSSNGASIRSNYATLDGTPIMTQLGGSVSTYLGTALGIDGIKEFRIITTGFGAQYGLTSGSQMLIVSKGGTNHFHGDVYEYLRNSHMDARNYFDNAFNSGGHRLPEFQRNDFGGSVGGPIKKNKTFFYAVFEGVRQNLGVSAQDVTFPQACFNEATAANNYMMDSACAPNLTSPVQMPAVMRPLFGLYPAPNGPGNTFSYTSNEPAREYYGQIRVDQNISSTDTFFARYTADNAAGNSPVGTDQAGFGGNFPGFRAFTSSRFQFLTLGENHIYSPTLLGVTHVSFSRTLLQSGNQYLKDVNGPSFSFFPGEPMGPISVADLNDMGPDPFLGPPNDYHVQNIYQLSEDINDTVGNHALQFGALVQRYNQGLASPLFTNGTIIFPTYASFMQGQPIAYFGLAPGSPGSNRVYWYNYFGFYLQDNWHVMSRLTLNLGLRYEFRTTPRETTGNSWAIRNRYTSPTSTQGPDFANNSLHNFSPRLGFAWDVFGNGKTAVRGAWGLYYDTANIGNVLQQTRLTIPPDTPLSTHVNFAGDVLTLPFTFAPGDYGRSLFTSDYNLGQPKGMQYSLSIQHQLPGQIAVTVAYVGYHGWNLYQTGEGNSVIPTSVAGFAPHAVPYWDPSIVSNCAYAVPACRLNPNFTHWNILTTGAYSWYNSFQFDVTKRISHGLQFDSAYTWSKSLDNSQSAQFHSDCEQAQTEGSSPIFGIGDYGLSCFDLKQAWNLSLMYHFPNIHSNNFAAKILHGWWMGNILTVNTGVPTTPLLGTNRSCNDGCGGDGISRPSLGTTAATTPNGNFVPYNSSTVIVGKQNEWFNPYMFMLQTPGYLGTAHRNTLRAPGQTELDFSVVKDTALPFLGEGGNLEFRAEFFNILNHTNFGFPDSTVFVGDPLASTTAYSEAPLPDAGVIHETATTSRQVQLALKILF
ncbi:MAG TPA: TonB-dependent receptor [Patescibacteria group bacterium]|nr:TonB-dependent receptor [Patescibacteria group bacterium]